MKKRFLLTLFLAFVMVFAVVAEGNTTEFSFGSDIKAESILVDSNESAKLTNGLKGAAANDKGVMVFTETRFKDAPSTMVVVLEEPLKIENISNIKTAQFTGIYTGYDADVIIHMMDDNGNKTTIRFVLKDTDKIIDAEYKLDFANGNYITDVRQRPIKNIPFWPFSTSNLYIYAIEYHMNKSPIAYNGEHGLNAQCMKSVSFVYDKSREGDNALHDMFENEFKVEEKTKSAITSHKEAVVAKRKAFEEREKALMAPEATADAK